jgi:flagellar motor switch protein FliN/FliY
MATGFAISKGIRSMTETPFDHINIDISVQLGSALIPIHQLLRMGRGAVIGLDTRDSDEVEVLANNVPVALGNVVLRGDRIGIEIREVLFRSPTTRPREQVKRV